MKSKSKTKTKYVCQSCGAFAPSWLGRCPECGEWDSYVEEIIETKPQSASKGKINTLKELEPIAIKDIELDQSIRISSELSELDLVLGSGIVKGSLVLIGGDPGIGKSTLLLQMAINLSQKEKVLYVSGEESLSQIKLRAQRINEKDQKDLSNVYLLADNEIKNIFKIIESFQPQYLIVDSIQTMYDDQIESAPGSVSQVREITHQLMLISKHMGITTFIIGHVTKSGNIAGPKVLEHMVDTVLYFEGEQSNIYRILRSVKNRFGSTNEIGIFQMSNSGLIGVSNPSGLFIENKPKDTAGSVISVSMEGSRPILVEVQALTSFTAYPSPRRLSIGVDYNRINLIVAILEKIGRVDLSNIDVYVNLVGGINISETAIDLPIAAAIYSIHRDKVIDDDTILFGELGLTGEIRGVSNSQRRIHEAIKLGFKNIIIPEYNLSDAPKDKANIIPVKNLRDLFKLFK